jgi:bleomycin hydrolase
MIKSFEKDLKITPEFRAIMNALKNRGFYEVFLNREVLRNHNNNYTYEIKTPTITNQKRTGRCWLYAGLNTIRPYVAKKLNMKNFKFSTSYLFFWDKMEKANYFLEKVISEADIDIRSIKFQKLLSSPVDDGGYWQGAVNLVKKYGAVPESAMPEVNSDENSSAMVRNITYVLRNYAYELKNLKEKGASSGTLRKKKTTCLFNIYKMLVLHLGEPVKTFYFRYYKKDKKGKKYLTDYKKYTPKEFAKEFINGAFDNFVMFANWPARKYYKLYIWKGSNNSIEGIPLTFINLPMKEIKPMMIESIKNGVPVNFSADVGKQLDRKRGIMNADLYRFEDVYGVKFNTDKKRNTLIRNINSTHAMVFTGLDIKDGKPLKWKVENSWGTKNGDNGFYAMYDNWVNLYVVRVVIDRKFIPEKYIKILKTKPIIIPETEPEK